MSASTAVRRRAERPLPASRQRGAIGLFGILTLLCGLLFTALAIDAGRLWMERRQLQSIADLAALEAAGTIGCAANMTEVLAAAQTAAARNGYQGNLAQSPNRVEVGKLQTVSGERQFIAGAASEAVHVLATQSVQASLLLGGLIGKQVLLSVEATARAEPAQATFGAGSYLLRVSATGKDANLLNLLLGGLLGSSLSLDVASYQGLANANVTLLQLLQVNATVGSVEELLNANLTIREVIDMTRGAVILHDSGLSTVIGALDSLLMNTVNALDLRLGDVLSVTTPVTDAAANLGINVLDLITATLMVANKNSAISLPLGINIPGLVNLSADINIIQPPQIAVGPAGRDANGNWCTEAKTAQIEVGATTFINVLGLATVDLKLGVQVAQGTAHLKSLVTQPGAAQAVIGATPGIASVTLTNQAGTGPATVSLLFNLIDLARIGINLPIQPGNATDLNYDIGTPIADKLPITQSVSSSLGESLENALKSPDALNVELLVIPGLGELLKLLSLGLIDLDDILDAVVNTVLSPLLGMLGEALLDPLLKLLGIQLGGLDVTLHDIQYKGGAQLVI